MKNLSLTVRSVFMLIIVLILILMIARNIYDFCTINHAPLCINHKRSYIKSVSLDNESLTCTVVLCIRNIRYEQIECNKIRLLLWGKNGDMKQFEVVDARPKNTDLNYISFPGLRSKAIECTFSVSNFGSPLSIDNIDISPLSYK